MKLPSLLQNCSISKRISVLSALVVLFVMAVILGVTYYKTKSALYANEIRALKTELDSVKGMVSVFDASARNSAERFSLIFISLVPADISVSAEKTIRIGTEETPTVRAGGAVLNMNFSQVDRFTQITKGSVATIFARRGDDFVRITTSLKKEDGSRAVGTLLDRSHPGYQKLLAGEEYLGKARLFGKEYMTKYTPIQDSHGKVIGSYFIGFDISDSMKAMSETIKKIKVGETGYFYVLDAAETKNKGTLVVHPAQEGKNIYEAKDASDRQFIKEIIEKKEGEVIYPWLNKELGETSPRDKIVVYTFFKSWNWVIAAGGYIDEIERQSASVVYTQIAVSLIGTAVIVVLLFVLISHILKPLGVFTAKVEEIASGNLAVEINAAGNDEIARLGYGMEKMVSSFNGTLKNMVNASARTVSSVEVLRTKAERANEGAKNQAEQATQIATAAEQMSQTITDISRNTAVVSETSADALGTAEQGKDVASGAVETVGKVYSSTIELSTMIDKLNGRVGEIGDIITVINDIADQTNLLALNAAIEAARAGEQGRGFAVVADEVRRLAERTMKATAEITQKIAAVQRETEQTTRSMGDASEEVTKATDYIRQVGETLDSIVEAVGRVQGQIGQIATAVDEQSAAAEEVAGNISRTSHIASEIEQLSRDVAGEVNTLAEVSEGLKNAASIFKLRS